MADAVPRTPDRQQAVQALERFAYAPHESCDLCATVADEHGHDTLCPRVLAHDALTEIAAKDAEIARLNEEADSTRRIETADVAFHALTVTQRDNAWQEIELFKAVVARQQADLTRLAEVGKADRDRAERLLSALHWAGDISELKTDGQWWARKNWRTVILDALFPLDAKEAARE